MKNIKDGMHLEEDVKSKCMNYFCMYNMPSEKGGCDVTTINGCKNYRFDICPANLKYQEHIQKYNQVNDLYENIKKYFYHSGERDSKIRQIALEVLYFSDVYGEFDKDEIFREQSIIGIVRILVDKLK